MKHYNRDEIFSGIRQVDWYIGGRKMLYPVFFRQLSSFGGLFPARISLLRQLLPDVRFSPARILPGVGLVSIHVIECTDMDFNGLSIAIVLNDPNLPKIPVYNIFRQAMQYNAYIYILYQLVTTDNASILLSEWASIPTPVVSMNLSHEPDRISCEVADKGDLICRLTGRTVPADHSDLMKCFCNYYENEQPQSWELKVGAIEHGFSFGTKDIDLTMGSSHPIAEKISKALLSSRALRYTYIPSAQAVLYGPERLQASNLKYLLHERLGFQMSEHLTNIKKVPERRVYSRNSVDLRAEILGTRRGRRLHEAVHVINLSKGGMYVKSDLPMDVGREVSANIEASKLYKTFWAKGKVVRNEEHAMAIQFTRSTYDEEEDLHIQ